MTNLTKTKRSLRERYLSRPTPEELKVLEKKRPLRIQERDIEILKYLFEHKLMNLRQLEYLLGMTRQGQKQSLRRRLRQLYRYHLVDQPEDSIYLRLKYPKDKEYNTSLYAISTRGVTVLCDHLGLDLERSRRKRRTDLNFRFLQHSLYLSQFYTTLELALRKKPRFNLAFWKQGTEIKVRLSQVNKAATGYELGAKSLLPDSFFAIQDLETKENLFYFAEADMSGQQRISTMLDKFRRYLELWRQERYLDLGIKRQDGFQVLTFCMQAQRVEELLKIFDHHLPWSDLSQDRKPEMFLFTSSFGSYDKPDKILGPIWKSPRYPKGQRLYSLLD